MMVRKAGDIVWKLQRRVVMGSYGELCRSCFLFLSCYIIVIGEIFFFLCLSLLTSSNITKK